MTAVRYLYSYSDEVRLDIDRVLLSGDSVPTEHIRGFAYWLSNGMGKAGKQTKPISDSYYNDILLGCKQTSHWFIKQFSKLDAPSTLERKMLAHDAIAADEADWAAAMKKVVGKSTVPDMTEEEISSLERFFNPDNQKGERRSEAVALRNYIIWRLAIEMGLRRGEILALRLKDCPSKYESYIKVARIEERGIDYTDPRGTKAPRPKTLSRDLGFVLVNSPIPALINKYITRYRMIDEVKHGRKTGKKKMPTHDFLFISHKDGAPLSYDTLEQISKNAKAGSGVPDFHWHLARHAFFNRAYLAAAEDEQSATRIKDLVYYGGWSDESSLDIYSRRARRDRARQALIFWQTDQASWDALNQTMENLDG